MSMMKIQNPKNLPCESVAVLAETCQNGEYSRFVLEMPLEIYMEVLNECASIQTKNEQY